MSKSEKGFSLLIAFGTGGGFFIAKDSDAIHIGLKWVGITLFFYDVENAFQNLIDERKELKKEQS